MKVPLICGTHQRWWESGLVARTCCAAVLLVAATLKLYEHSTDPSLGALHGNRGLSAIVIAYEMGLVAWLLAGVFPRLCRRVVLITFSGFAGVSLYLALLDAESCGCFGSVQSNPWVTVGIDLLLVFSIWSWDPGSVQLRLRASTASMVIVSLLPAIAVSLALATKWAGSDLYDDSTIDGERIVIIEADKWIGRQCPILRDIDIGQRLSHGSWLVVLYQRTCSHCQAVLPLYEQLAVDLANVSHAPRIALVQVPPYATDNQKQHAQWENGNLNENKEWFVTTPTELILHDGKVVDARVGEDVRGVLEGNPVTFLQFGYAASPRRGVANQAR